jgi:hypothetical protein
LNAKSSSISDLKKEFKTEFGILSVKTEFALIDVEKSITELSKLSENIFFERRINDGM